MRAYFFGNMYLSSIQQGIQAAHVVAELFNKYQDPSKPKSAYLFDWAKNYKTMILLNAGYGEEIYKLTEFFISKDNPYPWAKFHESKEALDGALTYIGIILPERIYETANECREKNLNPHFIDSVGIIHDLPTDLSTFERELILTINNYGLAM